MNHKHVVKVEKTQGESWISFFPELRCWEDQFKTANLKKKVKIKIKETSRTCEGQKTIMIAHRVNNCLVLF